MLDFTIPGKPVAKSRPRKGKNGVFYTPAATKDYEDCIAIAAKSLMSIKRYSMMTGPVKVSIQIMVEPPASWSKKKKAEALCGLMPPVITPDVDNVLKIILDGMNGIVYEDDRQVVCAHIERIYAEVGRVRILVHPYNTNPFIQR